jgi:hypothetical protein
LTIWVLLLGMVAVVEITMVGALVSLAGNIPDTSFLAILSRYLKKKNEPAGALLHPMEAAARLERLRTKSMRAAAVSAGIGVGVSVWALFAGWGPVAMLAITFWFIAGYLVLLGAPLVSWKRRAGRIRVEEAEGEPLEVRPVNGGETDTTSCGEDPGKVPGNTGDGQREDIV